MSQATLAVVPFPRDDATPSPTADFRTRLGAGARITEGSRLLAERMSPVYWPGDPRLAQRG